MHVDIENLRSNRPVSFRLNSGKTLRLGPKATETKILDVEVKNNTKVQKLQKRNIIALREAGKKKLSTTSHTKKEAKSVKRKTISSKN